MEKLKPDKVLVKYNSLNDFHSFVCRSIRADVSEASIKTQFRYQADQSSPTGFPINPVMLCRADSLPEILKVTILYFEMYPSLRGSVDVPISYIVPDTPDPEILYSVKDPVFLIEGSFAPDKNVPDSLSLAFQSRILRFGKTSCRIGFNPLNLSPSLSSVSLSNCL